ncbi:phosphonate ABC transporter, permease protein PhnE, partial [Acinetobacter baumannii]|nr:phosphonate ABC transporter, permease protein PhnE [Acinetobacter baumannii]
TYEKIRFGIIPQLIANFSSITIYRFDMNLRDATILGLVGAGGIGSPLIFAMNSYRWNQVGSILIGLIILILVVEFISNKLRNRLVNG